jgi:hypothetical protein
MQWRTGCFYLVVAALVVAADECTRLFVHLATQFLHMPLLHEWTVGGISVLAISAVLEDSSQRFTRYSPGPVVARFYGDEYLYQWPSVLGVTLTFLLLLLFSAAEALLPLLSTPLCHCAKLAMQTATVYALIHRPFYGVCLASSLAVFIAVGLPHTLSLYLAPALSWCALLLLKVCFAAALLSNWFDVFSGLFLVSLSPLLL